MSELLDERRYEAFRVFEAHEAATSGELDSVVFLTDRETAMATAAMAMGPLALMWQHTEHAPSLPVFEPATEHADVLIAAGELPELIELEVPTLSPERTQDAAAIYFAQSQYSLN